MNGKKLTVLFLLQKARINQKDECPIKCRVTLSSVRREFSTGYFINPIYWNSKKQLAKPSNVKNDFINTQLSLIKHELNQAILFLQFRGTDYSLEEIYSKYKGENQDQQSILQVFKSHNERIEMLIGKDYVNATLLKYKQSLSLLKSFIKFNFQMNDYQFKSLNLKFIRDYEFYLKTEKNLAQATVNKAIQRFRKIIKIAMSEGYIKKDPFLSYKYHRIKKQVVFLDPDSLRRLENFTFSQIRLQHVKDMFIFCCYTGLAFEEMSKLENNHIVSGFDGQQWIKMVRMKTSKEISIPLLPQALLMLAKYKISGDSNGKVFLVISNQKFNSYLKEIAEIVGLGEINLTHHIARKTFATTVLLYNDVPMEVVSKLLGHSKMSITQDHYGKIVDKKVSEHIKNLSLKLQGGI